MYYPFPVMIWYSSILEMVVALFYFFFKKEVVPSVLVVCFSQAVIVISIECDFKYILRA